ncbi:hypothetical protein ACLB1E_30240 [Escherichia coli]
MALGAPVLAINTIAVDDIINATEKGADLAISGTSDQPAGTQITVTLNGKLHHHSRCFRELERDRSGVCGLVMLVKRLMPPRFATDADGNSGSASHNVQVNTALPGVTINVVATDDIINAAEAGVDQTISGRRRVRRQATR